MRFFVFFFQNEEIEISEDDILSAALSEAGLHEFFEEPSTSTVSQSPVVVDGSTNNNINNINNSKNFLPASLGQLSTKLASPATASTGSSPDLPIDGVRNVFF